jgi:crotonobetainyl-CoA:carnitine CoA-transferase CaiB-like acyl-CoA transferase
MATSTEQIFIGIDDHRIELIGDELAAFQADRSARQAEITAQKAEIKAKEAARESALAKLAALGLTADEIAAL